MLWPGSTGRVVCCSVVRRRRRQPSPHHLVCALDKIKESPGLLGKSATTMLLAELMEKSEQHKHLEICAQISRAARLPTNQMPRFISRDDEKGGIFSAPARRSAISGIHSPFNIFFGPASLTVMEKDELGLSRCSILIYKADKWFHSCTKYISAPGSD